MLIRLSAVQQQTGLSRSTIYKRVSEGSFPRPIKTGPRTVAWIHDEVRAWINARIAESRVSFLG
jgi:prophage regulatory protein